MPKQSLLFFHRWLKSPFSIGAIAPSSRHLAKRMAELTPRDSRLPVVELGGGTGVVTDALLAAIGPERLIVVERDPRLYGFLVERYPQVRILKGDAAELSRLLEAHGVRKAAAVVSGLPLLAMPKPVQHAIVREAVAVLAEGAPFIQFTYGFFSPVERELHGLEGKRIDRVYRNLPPASIWLYRRAKGEAETRASELAARVEDRISRESARADPWPRKRAQGRRQSRA